jgi:predicted amidohydrolase
MFSTGFSMNAAALAEGMDGPTIRWLRESAAWKRCAITGSVIIREGSRNFNRLIWMRPDGSCDHYDKRHLFRMAGEHEHFTAGSRRLVVDIGGWRVCPLICYDLRFPVWSRNRGDYDCLLYIANWPKPRRSAWKVLLRARAIENQSYVIGVNRIGRDGQGVAFSGDSAVFDPKGVRLSRTRPDEEYVETLSLSYMKLMDYRAKFRIFLDADDFDLS